MKKVRKLLPDNIIFTGKIESWLSDMAKEGLHLKKLKNFYAVFEKGEPSDVEYRIMAFEEMPAKQHFTMNGWDIVHNSLIHKFIVVSSEKSTDFKEIHSKLVEESKDAICNHISQAMKSNIIGTVILSIIFLFLTLDVVKNFFDYTSLFSFGENAVYLFCLLFIFLYVVVESIRVSNLQKKLKNNEPINHHQNWKSYSPTHRLGFILLLACYPFIIIGQHNINFESTHAIYNTKLYSEDAEHIVRLSDIEDNENFYYKSKVKAIDNFTNGYLIETFLTPISYGFKEEGFIRDNDPKYSALYFYYNKLRFKSMAPKAFDDWVKYWSIKQEEDLKIVYPESKVFDQIAYLHIDRTFICAYVDNIFIYMIYEGEKTPDEIITVLEGIVR